MSAVHFSGGLSYRSGGGVTTLLAGWAACCSGDRAWRIKRLVRLTRDPAAATCKTCLRMIEKARRDGVVGLFEQPTPTDETR